MWARTGVVALIVTACSRGPVVEPAPPPPQSMPQLARYMRENVNVPFSYAMMESEAGKAARVTYAANVLHRAAQGLVEWKDLSGQSDAARARFVEYAKNLERHVDDLQTATADVGYHLEAVRQACNTCHRAFRLANRLDVIEGVKR